MDKISRGVSGFLVLLIGLHVAAAADISCPLSIENCVCEEGSGGHDYWCPDRYDHDFRIHYKSSVIFIVCSPDKRLLDTDLILKAREIKLNKALKALVLQSCPLLKESYSVLTQAMNVTKLEKFIMKDVYGEDDHLVRDQFSGMEGLESLNIENVLLQSADEDTFQNASSSLYTLSFIGTDLKRVPENLLDPLPNLKHIELMESNLQELPENLFQHQSKVETLSFSAKSLREIPAKIFNQMTSLKDLTIKRLALSSGKIPPNLFEHNNNLLHFNITGSGFEDAPANLFRNTSLESFDWSVYQCPTRSCSVHLSGKFIQNIRTLHYFGFTNSYRLTNLTIEEDFFKGCQNLDEVEFKRVGLTTLPGKLFHDSPRLRKIELSYNQIAEIQPETFTDISYLRVLRMSRNKLTKIEDGTFWGLSKLIILDLSYNSIHTIGKSVFHPLESLRELSLDFNNIHFTDQSQPRWRSLGRLKRMNLAHNNITLSAIPPDWTSILLEVENLNVSHNAIGPVLDIETMKFQQRSITIDLSFNEIAKLDFSKALMLQPPGKNTFYLPTPLIILDGNPIICDCTALPLAQLIKSKLPNEYVSSWFKIADGSIPCQDRSNRHLTELPFKDFSCAFPMPETEISMTELIGLQCPSSCTCRFIPATETTAIDCKALNMTVFHAELPEVPGTTLISLDLCNNELRESLHAMRSNVEHYDNITDLSLCENYIEHLSSDDLPKGLRKLNIQNNSIKSFDDDFYPYLGSLSEIKMANNLFGCDCSTKTLLEFIRKHPNLISDVHLITVKCNDVVKPILQWKPSELCRDLVALVLPISFAVILILMVIIVCLYFKKNIQIRIYSYPVLRKIFFLDDLEEKPFDAFISYSNEDADFVENKLVPGLEQGDNLKYKCIVHVRDFEVGRNVLEQICDAVDKSRRTVIVLSKNFVKSAWYNHEFSMAHDRRRVVVIVYGEMPSKDDMGSLMWSYISANTYLAHSDPLFWEKLRYALPHKGRRAGPKMPFQRALQSRKTIDEIGLIDKRSPTSHVPLDSSPGGSTSPPPQVSNGAKETHYEVDANPRAPNLSSSAAVNGYVNHGVAA